jgi:CPA2 family monovalent cation:H+ antiporter-2
MLLNTGTIFHEFFYVAMVVLVIIGVKILTGTLSALVLGMPDRVCVFTGLALCQIGEFSFVLAKNGVDNALIPVAVYQVFLAGAIITMALTPFFMNASPRVMDILYRLAPYRYRQSEGTEPERAAKEQELTDHVVIAGYGITGKSVARAAKIAGIPYMVIELDPEIIRKERSAFRPNFMFGDAVQEEVLLHAGIQRARTLVVAVSDDEAIPRIIHTARRLAPEVHILARTRHVREAQSLLDLGANEIISEEFEAALEIFSRVLKKYRSPDTEIAKIIQRMKKLGIAMFTKGAEEDSKSSRPKTIFAGLHVHTFRVEPGSAAEGKTIDGLDLKNHFGIADMGLRSGKNAVSQVTGTTLLKAGDVLIVFTTDEKAVEIAGLFSGV